MSIGSEVTAVSVRSACETISTWTKLMYTKIHKCSCRLLPELTKGEATTHHPMNNPTDAPCPRKPAQWYAIRTPKTSRTTCAHFAPKQLPWLRINKTEIHHYCMCVNEKTNEQSNKNLNMFVYTLCGPVITSDRFSCITIEPYHIEIQSLSKSLIASNHIQGHCITMLWTSTPIISQPFTRTMLLDNRKPGHHPTHLIVNDTLIN